MISLTDVWCIFGIMASSGYALPSSLYKRLTPSQLKLLESREATPTPEKTSKPLECHLITSLDLSTIQEIVTTRLALERVREQAVVPCVLCLTEAQACILVCKLLGALVACRLCLQRSGLEWKGNDDFMWGT